MSMSDKISWVGGMMGLFTGFSVISGIEILYWLWFKVIFNKKGKVAPGGESYTVIKELRDEVDGLKKEFAEMRLKVKSHHDDQNNSLRFTFPLTIQQIVQSLLLRLYYCTYVQMF